MVINHAAVVVLGGRDSSWLVAGETTYGVRLPTKKGSAEPRNDFAMSVCYPFITVFSLPRCPTV